MNNFPKFYNNCRSRIAFLLGKYNFNFNKEDKYFFKILDSLTLKYLASDVKDEDDFILKELQFFSLISTSVKPLFKEDILTTNNTFLL